MSKWLENQLDQQILHVLTEVESAHDDDHHMGRPTMTAYQIAIDLVRRHPMLLDDMDMHTGGEGTGDDPRESLPRYNGNRLSRAIEADQHYVIEGMFMSGRDMVELSFRAEDGEPIRNSTADPSLFRVRPQG